MTETDIENLRSFQDLIIKRSRMVWSLSLLLIIVLTGNLLLMSVGASIGSRTLSETSPLTIVLIYSIFVIFFGAFCCLFYVWWANKYLDPVIRRVKRDVSEHLNN